MDGASGGGGGSSFWMAIISSSTITWVVSSRTATCASFEDQLKPRYTMSRAITRPISVKSRRLFSRLALGDFLTSIIIVFKV